MEYKKITNLLDNTFTPTSKFRTKNLCENNFDERGTFDTNSRIK